MKEEFYKLCELPPGKIMSICENALKYLTSAHYLLDPSRCDDSDRMLDIKFWRRVGKTDLAPMRITYSIRYYDNLDLEITANHVILKETMEHCNSSVTYQSSFEEFYNTYIKDELV